MISLSTRDFDFNSSISYLVHAHSYLILVSVLKLYMLGLLSMSNSDCRGHILYISCVCVVAIAIYLLLEKRMSSFTLFMKMRGLRVMFPLIPRIISSFILLC